MNGDDLFSYHGGRYPGAPGYKRRDTARAAAEETAPRAPTLRQRCLDALENSSATADEIAQHLDETVLSVRPRVAELALVGLIEDTGLRRPNVSGKLAIVWRIKT